MALSHIRLSISHSISTLWRRVAPIAALLALVVAMGGTWTAGLAVAAPTAAAAQPATKPPPSAPAGTRDEDDRAPPRPAKKEVSGKLNLNTATEDQLVLLPSVGPSKAERILVWRKKNGAFKRVADLRRVKGFGYRTYKRLEPFLDIKGESTIAPKR